MLLLLWTFKLFLNYRQKSRENLEYRMGNFEAEILGIASLEEKAWAELHLIVNVFVHASKSQERTEARHRLAC